MRPEDFFYDEDESRDPFGLVIRPRLNDRMIDELRRRPLEDRTDVEVAVPLARLVHDDLEAFGTSGGTRMDEGGMREALQALRAVVQRLGIDDFNVPFRDFSSFRTWWLANGAHGSWQARRDLLAGIFNSLHDTLAEFEQEALASSLVSPISPRARTGWAAVDTEISELRRHFLSARTPQDYRAVGLDCVAVTSALSRQVFDPELYVREREEEPPVGNTKQRLERFIDVAAPGSDNAALRRLARASIEYAEHVKHSSTPTRREAGLAADAVILLANLLRRLNEPE